VEFIDVSIKHTSKKSNKDVEIIDVDAIPAGEAPTTSSGQAAAQAVNTNKVIDVDDPRSWTGPGSSIASGGVANPRSDPLFKFDGELGAVLHAQKMEVVAEDDVAPLPVAAATTSSVAREFAADVRSSAEAQATDVEGVRPELVATRFLGVRGMTLREAVEADRVAILGDREAALNMPWPPVVADASAAAATTLAVSSLAASSSGGGPATGAAPASELAAVAEEADDHSRPRKVARFGKAAIAPGCVAVPTVRLGRSRSKWDDKPRLPRKAFVRKAAVMSVVRRIIAGPPSPPPGGSESESASSASNSADEPESNRFEGSPASGVGVEDVERDGGANENMDNSGAGADAGGGAKSNAGGSGAGTQENAVACGDAGNEDGDGDDAGGGAKRNAGGRGTGTRDNAVTGGDAGNEDGDGGDDGNAAVLDVLAHELASRSRNPRLFPAECWVPAAHAVLAAAQASSALPPSGPAANRGSVSIGVLTSPSAGIASTPGRTAAPPPQPPASPPLRAPFDALDGESSEEMDDDELVMAYVTPPASPAPMASPTSSPFRAGSSSGKRRRSSDFRAARTGVAASGPSADVDAHLPHSSATLRRVLDAMRSGFSSVRREVTRLRAEVLIVKSQAASTLRRMDGLAAAADERDSRSDVVLGRLGELDGALRLLSTRMPSSHDDATRGQEGGNESLALVAEIKVSCDLLRSALVLALGEWFESENARQRLVALRLCRVTIR